MTEEKRKHKCICGSTIFFQEIIQGQKYIFCAGLKCNKSWPAKRKDDEIMPHFQTIKEDWR